MVTDGLSPDVIIFVGTVRRRERIVAIKLPTLRPVSSDQDAQWDMNLPPPSVLKGRQTRPQGRPTVDIGEYGVEVKWIDGFAQSERKFYPHAQISRSVRERPLFQKPLVNSRALPDNVPQAVMHAHRPENPEKAQGATEHVLKKNFRKKTFNSKRSRKPRSSSRWISPTARASYGPDSYKRP